MKSIEGSCLPEGTLVKRVRNGGGSITVDKVYKLASDYHGGSDVHIYDDRGVAGGRQAWSAVHFTLVEQPSNPLDWPDEKHK